MKNFLNYTLWVIVFIMLPGCTKPEDKAKKLGFNSVEQMNYVKKLGFNSMTEYEKSVLPGSGCATIEEVEHAMSEVGGDCNLLKKIRKQEAEKYDNEISYYAVVTCGQLQLHNCFADGGLSVRNGRDFKTYTRNEIISIPGLLLSKELVFDLRNSFEIKMQNSEKDVFLNLKIFEKSTNNKVYDKSAALYEVIRASN